MHYLTSTSFHSGPKVGSGHSGACPQRRRFRVFFRSRASLQSRSVESELTTFADASGKRIFPILIGGTDYSDLPIFLSHYQAVVLRDRSEVREVAGASARILKSTPTAALGRPAEAEYRV